MPVHIIHNLLTINHMESHWLGRTMQGPDNVGDVGNIGCGHHTCSQCTPLHLGIPYIPTVIN